LYRIIHQHKIRRRNAFTLTEILVVLLIAPLLLFGMAATAMLPLRSLRADDDISAARDRAERVFAILGRPLEQCGYGLPKTAHDYKKAFSSAFEPLQWPGPLSVATHGNRENGVCRIAYAARSKLKTISQASSSSDKMELVANKIPPKLTTDVDAPNPGNRVSDWVLFGSMTPYCLPMRQRAAPVKGAKGTANLSLTFNRPDPDGVELVVPENDELYYLRVMECFVEKRADDYALVTNDHMNTGRQIRVEGVVDVRFEIDASGYFMRVWALTRGRHRYPEMVTTGAIPGWPEKYAASIPDEMRRYRLMAHQSSFALMNL
jgi:type II secretory pathway pseudopilin PulG